ncbi:hypothetical protein DAI22_09g154550 [Oryza sativa Japonica Group]|nr:hypothetical protein DAI22_09g154550 [Oryza sativa Japonica Group]
MEDLRCTFFQERPYVLKTLNRPDKQKANRSRLQAQQRCHSPPRRRVRQHPPTRDQVVALPAVVRACVVRQRTASMAQSSVFGCGVRPCAVQPK